jgi:Gas vesicle synthesis protein GvpL/GvpF
MRDWEPEPEDLRWAADIAPRLLEEARADAIEEVRARLRDRLVEALLSTVAPQARPAADEPAANEPAAEEPAADEPTGDDVGLWVYGVVRGDMAAAPECSGVDGAHGVELIRDDDGLAAIVSRVPLHEFDERALQESLEDLDRLEVLARAHERVLDEALPRGSVVPCRMCTIFETADGVRDMLARERGHLTDTLQRLEGKAEWGVKAYAVSRAGAEPAPDPEPASGADYLSRKRAYRLADERSRQVVDVVVDAVHDRLSERAADAALSPPQSGPLSGHEGEMVLNAAYLVPEADTERFRALVGELAGRVREEGLELELTGPWPAYHFSSESR